MRKLFQYTTLTTLFNLSIISSFSPAISYKQFTQRFFLTIKIDSQYGVYDSFGLSRSMSSSNENSRADTTSYFSEEGARYNKHSSSKDFDYEEMVNVIKSLSDECSDNIRRDRLVRILFTLYPKCLL